MAQLRKENAQLRMEKSALQAQMAAQCKEVQQRVEQLQASPDVAGFKSWWQEVQEKAAKIEEMQLRVASLDEHDTQLVRGWQREALYHMHMCLSFCQWFQARNVQARNAQAVTWLLESHGAWV